MTRVAGGLRQGDFINVEHHGGKREKHLILLS